MTAGEYIEQNNIDKGVTSLDISVEGITSLKGIEELQNLTELWCDNNQLTDLNAIRDLKNLRWLNCSVNQLLQVVIPHGGTLKDYQEWLILDYYKDIDFDS